MHHPPLTLSISEAKIGRHCFLLSIPINKKREDVDPPFADVSSAYFLMTLLLTIPLLPAHSMIYIPAGQSPPVFKRLEDGRFPVSMTLP